MKQLKCKNCGSNHIMKCLCFGLPMKLCIDCTTGWGIGSYLFGWSGGHLLAYQGNYWYALWYWLTRWQ